MKEREKRHLAIFTIRNEVVMTLVMRDPDEDFVFRISPTHALRFAEDLIREARKVMERGDADAA